MILKNVRVAYPHLFVPYAYMDGPNKKYEVTLLIPKDDQATIETIKRAAAAAARKKWPTTLPKGLASALKDGDEKEQEAYHGHWLITPRATPRDGEKPGVVLPNLQPAEASDIQSGDWCNVDVTAFGYDNVSRGVSFGLQNVQLVAKGDRIGGGQSRPENVFEAIRFESSAEDAGPGEVPEPGCFRISAEDACPGEVPEPGCENWF